MTCLKDTFIHFGHCSAHLKTSLAFSSIAHLSYVDSACQHFRPRQIQFSPSSPRWFGSEAIDTPSGLADESPKIRCASGQVKTAAYLAITNVNLCL